MKPPKPIHQLNNDNPIDDVREARKAIAKAKRLKKNPGKAWKRDRKADQA